MGYQITFVPTEEQMEKYKPWKGGTPSDQLQETIDNDILSITAYCMKAASESDSSVAKSLNFQLKCLYSMVERQAFQDAYNRWKDDEDHELWYCGWEYSKDDYMDKATQIKFALDELFMLSCIVPTPNYFTDKDNFFDKLTEIKNQLSEFVDSSYETACHIIVEDLRAAGAEKKYLEEDQSESSEE